MVQYKSINQEKRMKIQILGTGCPKCKKLAKNAESAAKELRANA
jgi:hypothetical protein